MVGYDLAVSRRFAKKCADYLYMELECTKNRVSGRKRVVLDLNGVKLPFDLEVKGHYADLMEYGGDAGLLLQGPGSLTVAVVRHHGEMFLRVMDLRLLEPNRTSLAKWWSAVRNDVVDSKVFFDMTERASKGTYTRSGGEWITSK